jgi:hypothetical protein
MINAHELCSTLPFSAIIKLLTEHYRTVSYPTSGGIEELFKIGGFSTSPNTSYDDPGPPADAETRSKVK